jgi:hypothetical protein
MEIIKSLAKAMIVLIIWIGAIWASVYLWNNRDQYPRLSYAVFVLGGFSIATIIMYSIWRRFIKADS